MKNKIIKWLIQFKLYRRFTKNNVYYFIKSKSNKNYWSEKLIENESNELVFKEIWENK